MKKVDPMQPVEAVAITKLKMSLFRMVMLCHPGHTFLATAATTIVALQRMIYRASLYRKERYIVSE
jgi:hypothetical protein